MEFAIPASCLSVDCELVCTFCSLFTYSVTPYPATWEKCCECYLLWLHWRPGIHPQEHMRDWRWDALHTTQTSAWRTARPWWKESLALTLTNSVGSWFQCLIFANRFVDCWFCFFCIWIDVNSLQGGQLSPQHHGDGGSPFPLFEFTDAEVHWINLKFTSMQMLCSLIQLTWFSSL